MQFLRRTLRIETQTQTVYCVLGSSLQVATHFSHISRYIVLGSGPRLQRLGSLYFCDDNVGRRPHRFSIENIREMLRTSTSQCIRDDVALLLFVCVCVCVLGFPRTFRTNANKTANSCATANTASGPSATTNLWIYVYTTDWARGR